MKPGAEMPFGTECLWRALCLRKACVEIVLQGLWGGKAEYVVLQAVISDFPAAFRQGSGPNCQT